MKFGQIDTKYKDIQVVDAETGEVLGRAYLTLLTLPHYGNVPIGMALLLEPPSYRSAMMALRDAFRRFGDLPRFIAIDGGSEFNNTEFDKLLGVFGISKSKGGPRDPRKRSGIESRWSALDAEMIHEMQGNTVPLTHVREMSKEFDPKKNAVWTLPDLYDELEHYFFTMLWDAPSAMLGTTPRTAFNRDLKLAPERRPEGFVIPNGAEAIAFLPDVRNLTRKVRAGNGIWVEGYYYFSDKMEEPGVIGSKVRVRYDPFDLYTVYAAIGGEWAPCVARFAPELRNLTERHRFLHAQIWRRMRRDHGKKRDAIHGRALADNSLSLRNKEKLRKEQMCAKAQQRPEDVISSKHPNSKTRTPLPRIRFEFQST
jgi:putative transposase